MAPHTGFEPASLLQPTVFKTAPSPPGHTAYIIKVFHLQNNRDILEYLFRNKFFV